MQEPRPPTRHAEVEAFGDLYHRTGTAVLGYALRRAATREDAMDAVAETFTVAWRRRADTPGDPDEVRPWLFGIARRCLADIGRSSVRAERLGARLAASFVDAPVPDPAAAVAAAHDHRVVREAMALLTEIDRELVALVAWEGLTPAQAAVALDLTPAATRVRLHRARTKLRDALSSAATNDEEADRDR